MIKNENGHVEIKGNAAVLCAELEDLICAIEGSFSETFGRKVARQIIDSVIKSTRMSDEEKEKAFEEAKANIPPEIVKGIKEMLLKDALKQLFGGEVDE